MNARKCKKCGHEFTEWVEFCPDCSEPMEGFSRPAGFWIRAGAYIIDILIFLPIGILNIWNTYSLKSSVVLILISLPMLIIYKPFMESFFGATLGKMSCKIKVIDDNGKKLSLFSAYLRFFPFLLLNSVSLVGQLLLFLSPQFQSAKTMIEIGEIRKENSFAVIVWPLLALVLIDCIFVAFTFRKRALHDMMAESFCVYKEP